MSEILSTPSPSRRRKQTSSSPEDRADGKNIVRPLRAGESLRGAAPKQILMRILDEVRRSDSRHYKRYGAFLDEEGEETEKLMKRCVTRETWGFFEVGRTKMDIERIKNIGGNLQFHGRAIYLHIIPFADGTVRFYVGQAKNLSYRIKQHGDFRYRRDNPSLHYYAIDRSASGDVYVILATIREKCARDDLVLNLLEFWMALAFGTMLNSTIVEWLGEWDGERSEVKGLNVALPLDGKEASQKAFWLLKESRDEMAKRYFWDTKNGTLRPKPIATQTAPSNLKWREKIIDSLIPFLMGAGVSSIVIGVIWRFSMLVKRP